MIAPPALFQHHWQNVLAGEKCAGEIEIEPALPAVLANFERTAHDRHTDIVVQHVDAPVLR